MKALSYIVISAMFLFWFAGSIGGMIYVSRQAELQWLIPVILGQFLLVFGIIGFIAILSSHAKGLWIDVIAMLAGAGAIILPLVYHYGSPETQAAIEANIPALAGAGALIAGLSGALGAYIGQRRSAKKYCTPAQGVCVEQLPRLGSGGAVLTCPVYEITVHGEAVRLQKNVFTNVGIPKIGESRTLYIDENDTEWYAEPIADKGERRIGYFISISFAAAGLVTLLMTSIK